MQWEGPKFKSLLAPEDCAIVLIRCSTGDLAAAGPLLQASETYDVPAIVVMTDGAVCSLSAVPAFACSGLNPLSDAYVRRALVAFRRPRLLIGGGLAETVLSFAVLSALEEGYDVHLLRDLVSGISDSLVEVAADRMVQASAVPVSVPQVVAEWQCVTQGRQTDTSAAVAGVGPAGGEEICLRVLEGGPVP